MCVCFDCDSTLSTLEGIDELAARLNLESKIAPLTAAAMDGRIAIEAVYARRMALIKPDRESLMWLGQRYIATLVPGAHEAFAILRKAKRSVHIVSGGLKPAILPLAAHLGVAADHVEAVDVDFDRAGHYRGFDAQSPLARADGKARVTAALARVHGPVVVVGDGVTDVAARAGGAIVIGFGGVARREAVVSGADIFVDGPSLVDVARLICG